MLLLKMRQYLNSSSQHNSSSCSSNRISNLMLNLILTLTQLQDIQHNNGLPLTVATLSLIIGRTEILIPVIHNFLSYNCCVFI